MLLNSDIDSSEGLVPFTTQGSAVLGGSVDISGRRHPVKSRIKAIAAMEKVENTASLMTGACWDQAFLHECIKELSLKALLVS